MDSDPALAAVGLAAAALLTAFFTLAEAALLGRRLLRPALLVPSRHRLAGLTFDRARFLLLATALLGLTAAAYLAVVSLLLLLSPLGPIWAPIATFLLLYLLLTAVRAWAWALGAADPQRAWRALRLPLAALGLVALPVTLPLWGLTLALLLLLRVHPRDLRAGVTEDEFKDLVAETARDGSLPEPQRRMIYGVLDFADRSVAQAMTPRPDMVSVAADQSLREAIELALEHSHSRLPVYGENDDDILGVLHLKDTLPYLRDQELDQPAPVAARPAVHVPEMLPARELLRQMQRTRQSIAIAHDEYGGTAGLVTVEDLLEEIVGEIQDEYDAGEEPELVRLGEQEWSCDPLLSLEALANELREDLPEEHESLAAFVLHLAGRIPAPGEAFAWGRLRFVAERVQGVRLERVRVIRELPTGLPTLSPWQGPLTLLPGPLILLGLGLLAWASLREAALRALGSGGRLETAPDDPRAAALRGVLADPRTSACLLGLRTAAAVLVPVGLCALLPPQAGALAGWTTPWLLGLLLVQVLLGELFPAVYGAARAESVALRSAPGLSRLVARLGPACGPALGLLRSFGHSPALARLAAEEPVTPDHIRAAADLGEAAGEFHPEVGRMLDEVMDLSHTTAREVMTPRVAIVGLPADARAEAVLQAAMESGFSRLPVHEGDLDNLVGLLYVTDLVGSLARGERDFTARDLARPLMTALEDRRALDLLREMRDRAVHLAVVVDSSGGTEGLVTIEDILEELVGEIADEHDAPDEEIRRTSPGELLVEGGVRLEEIEEALGVNLPATEAETVAGLLTLLFGRLPREDEAAVFGGVWFSAVEMEGRQIKQVRVTRPSEEVG